MDDLREVIARAVWDGPDSRSGDPIGVTIHLSDHLFPQQGETEIDAAKGICMDAADAALAAIKQAATKDRVRAALTAIDREDDELYHIEDLLAFFCAMIEASNAPT